MRPFRSIETRTSVGGDEPGDDPTEAHTPPEEAPTAAHEPLAGGAGGHPPEPPTQAHQPAWDGDGPRHTGRKVGAPLVILGLVAAVAWGLPILQGFH